MSSFDVVFQDFTDALWRASDEDGLRSAVGRAAEDLGFRWYAYLGLGNGSPILISSYSKDWTDHYFRQSYEKIDPVVAAASTGSRLFPWGRDDPSLVRSRDQRRFFSEATAFGIDSGLTVPIRSGRGKLAALTLATDRSLKTTKETTAAAADMLQLLALYFHSRVEVCSDGVRREPPAAALTPRELQCLTWAARGKTAGETAEILDVGRRTVTFHLENARMKLEASTVTQAVYRSTVAGFIPPE